MLITRYLDDVFVTGRINVSLKRPSEAFNHEVSILRSFSEKPRGARPRLNVSMTFIRPPQHGHRREGEVGSALSSSFARAWFFLSGAPELALSCGSTYRGL
jgi:hypothetical protein